MERLGRLTDDASMHTISLMRLMGMLALGSFLVHALVRKWRLYSGPAILLYSAYCLLAILSLTYTEHPLGTVRAIGAILGNLLFLFLVVNVVRSWDLARAAMVVWLCATVLMGFYTLYDWYWGPSVDVEQIGMTEARFRTVMEDTSEWERLDLVRRAVGPTSSAAVYAINLILAVPFFFCFLRQARSRGMTVLLWASLIIVTYNVLLTNTRAAVLLLAVVVVLSAARGLLPMTPRRMAFAAALIVALPLLAPQAVVQRILDLERYQFAEAGTFQIRANYWKAGLQIAEERWLTGFGVGNQLTIPRYLRGDGPEETTVHNEFLMTLLEVGVVGWVVFFGFVGLLLYYAFRGARLIRDLADRQDQYWFLVACQVAMIAVLLYGLQVDVFHFPLKGWWLIAGLSYVLYRLAQDLVKTPATPVNTEVA
jgi:hypothetical protein